jgi:adenylate kinase family enzyme
VLGPGGAGKSELAAALAQVTGLPVVHLDRIFWRGGWEAAPADEARRELANAVEAERWILDGNFLDADDDRFARADTVLFLDMPRRVCLRQVLWRLLRDRRRSRPDLPEGCRETLDLELLRWIWRYPRVDRPRVLELLAELGDDAVDVHHLRSRRDVRKFLEEADSAQRGRPGLAEEPPP